jgi:hypothetical protein
LGPGRGVALWDLQGWLGICRGVGLGVDVAVAATGLRLRARRGISGLRLLIEELRYDGQAGELEIRFRDLGLRSLGREVRERRSA